MTPRNDNRCINRFYFESECVYVCRLDLITSKHPRLVTARHNNNNKNSNNHQRFLPIRKSHSIDSTKKNIFSATYFQQKTFFLCSYVLILLCPRFRVVVKLYPHEHINSIILSSNKNGSSYLCNCLKIDLNAICGRTAHMYLKPGNCDRHNNHKHIFYP